MRSIFLGSLIFQRQQPEEFEPEGKQRQRGVGIVIRRKFSSSGETSTWVRVIPSETTQRAAQLTSKGNLIWLWEKIDSASRGLESFPKGRRIISCSRDRHNDLFRGSSGLDVQGSAQALCRSQHEGSRRTSFCSKVVPRLLVEEGKFP